MRHGFPGQARDVDGNNLEVVERAVLQRIVVTGFAKVPFRKGNGVRHDDAPGTQFARVDLEGRGIKNDQNIGSVAGGINLPASEIDLIGGNTIGRPDRSADLGGKIREGRKIVAGKGRGQGEPPAGQLDTVAGVAGEPDDDRFSSSRAASRALDSGCGISKFIVGFNPAVRLSSKRSSIARSTDANGLSRRMK